MIILLFAIMTLATGCAELDELRQYKQEQQARQAQNEADRLEKQREEERAYREWYKTLTADQQMAERQRKEAQREREQARQDAMMLQMLNMSNQNMNAAMDRMQNSFKYTPPTTYTPPQYNEWAPTPRTRTNCTTNLYGNQANTYCY